VRRFVVLPLLLTLTMAGQSGSIRAGAPPKVATPPGPYLVLVDGGQKDEFLPAARALAALHGAVVKRFDPKKLDQTLAELRKAPPRFVVFVLPPEKIDVDLAHDILEMATRVDDDPFVDFEYGFVTGRDGLAALRFVRRIEAAWKRDFGNKAALFGSWEGEVLPTGQPLSALKTAGLSAEQRLVKVKGPAEERRKAARQALADCKGKDALLFFSHGYPDSMEFCFRAKDLRAWKADLSPAILVNCACYNGAPGRWFAPGPTGPVERKPVGREDSVALAVLDSGVAGYFAGVDPWHGPLAIQVFAHITDDGLRLGEAAKRMYDRLALDFLPGRIHFEPTLKVKDRFGGEGVVSRRHNGAGMIFYGDPALAPFAKKAKRLLTAEVKSTGNAPLRLRLVVKPLLDGEPGVDFMLPQARLMDYYSVKTADFQKELKLEVYRAVPLPAECKGTPALRVVSARSGDKDVPTRAPQLVVEDTPRRKVLHVRVPLDVRATDFARLLDLARKGITIDLEEKR
jgi:hypothetical protein